MAEYLSTVVDRFCRIYSGNGFYATAFQIDQPSIPIMEPRSDYEIQPDGGRMTTHAGTFVTDETAPFRGIEISLRVALMSERLDMIHAIGNPFRNSPWVVGGDTWTGVATNALGTRLDSRGNAVPCVFPPDSVQRQYMVNFCWTNQVQPDATAGTAMYGEARGLFITNATEDPDGQLIYVTITGMIMGTINPRLTAWPAGTESVPS